MSHSIRPRWPQDYHGLTITNNAGYALGGDAFREAVKAGKIKLQESGGNRSNLMKLGLKRVDCYMNDRLSILYELERLKQEGLYDEGGTLQHWSKGRPSPWNRAFSALPLGMAESSVSKRIFSSSSIQ